MTAFRLDRALSLARFPRSLQPRQQFRIPILMYHSIRDEVEKGHPYFQTSTSPEVFEQHLQFLREQGYVGVYAEDVVRALGDESDQRRVVAITFDDGYKDFYTNAFPLIKKYQFNATLFVVSAFVGGRCRHRQREEEFMTWQEIREVCEHGVQIGSHTVTHRDLYCTDWRTLGHEVCFSKGTIESEIGQRVRSFAYPYAFPETDKDFGQRLANLLERSGYENGVCTAIGRACRKHSRFFLPRLPINSHDDLSLFRAKLDGHYDWLHTPQYAYKALKTLLARLTRLEHGSSSALPVA
jgi:peptidoglycan/xylan/chitin deacetylase (PgdA/CDA1 family)